MEPTDATQVLDELFAQTLDLIGRPPVGETRQVAFVRWPDGRPGVLTVSRRSKADLDRVTQILGPRADKPQ
jgi:hypothetical protein